jgi:hypothetical protein
MQKIAEKRSTYFQIVFSISTKSKELVSFDVVKLRGNWYIQL